CAGDPGTAPAGGHRAGKGGMLRMSRPRHFSVASRGALDVDLAASGRQWGKTRTRRARPKGDGMATDIRRDADQLMRYYGELMHRLTQNGVRDVAELLTLYESLQRAVSALTPQEISWACDQVQALIRQLVGMDSNLQALRRLKLVFSQLPGSGGTNAGQPA